jgi:hypothetical protein
VKRVVPDSLDTGFTSDGQVVLFLLIVLVLPNVPDYENDQENENERVLSARRPDALHL